MKSNSSLVSIIIPTKNSAAFLDNCLKCIRLQSHPKIEIIIVDGKSTDNVRELAKKYGCNFYTYVPKVKEGAFDAPHKRNYGVKKARGEYVYWLDVDMELSKNLIAEAVDLCKGGMDAVILPEDSFGIGVWASAKNLERRCYWGDDTVEAPRFFKKNVWKNLGGLDENLGGGGDDWDLHQKLLVNKYKVGRAKNVVRHNEGNLKLVKLLKKRFMYSKDSLKYISKRPKEGFVSYFPIRKAYVKNWKLFASRPKDTFSFIIMRSFEYLAGMAGVIYSIFNK
jgi:arabinofuranan 3-O-arabinosyltransferase